MRNKSWYAALLVSALALPGGAQTPAPPTDQPARKS